jgi:hypothetical protein
MLTNPRTVCFCPPVSSMMPGKVAALPRFIRAITSAFWLLRDSVSPFFAWARREALPEDFFDRVPSARKGVACGATLGINAAPLPRSLRLQPSRR